MVSEGAGARSTAEDMDHDDPALGKWPFGLAMSVVESATVAVSSNQAPPADLEDLAAKVEEPLLLIAGALTPIGMGIAATHKWREPVGEPPSVQYRDVTFTASDGLGLAGWYRPSENGATVVVVHRGSSDRKGSLHHARMLARHGYGVLVYEPRPGGESDGSENNYGWDWDRDVAGALAFSGPARTSTASAHSASRPRRRPDRSGGRPRDVAALVPDGAAAGSFADVQRLGNGGLLEQAPPG